MKSKIKILLSPTQDVLEGELDPVNMFRVLAALKDGGHFQPQVCVFDQEMNDWTCWQSTETEANQRRWS